MNTHLVLEKDMVVLDERICAEDGKFLSSEEGLALYIRDMPDGFALFDIAGRRFDFDLKTFNRALPRHTRTETLNTLLIKMRETFYYHKRETGEDIFQWRAPDALVPVPQIVEPEGFAPAIGYCLFGERVLKEYSLSVKSLDQIGDYDGDIIIAGNTPPEKVRALTPEKYQKRLKFIFMEGADIHDFQVARLHLIAHPVLHAYNPFVYLDADVLATAPLMPFLKQASAMDQASAMAQPWMDDEYVLPGGFYNVGYAYQAAPFDIPEKMSPASVGLAGAQGGFVRDAPGTRWEDSQETAPIGEDNIALRRLKKWVPADQRVLRVLNGGVITVPKPAEHKELLKRPFDMARQWIEFHQGKHRLPLDEPMLSYSFAKADFLDPFFVSNACLPSGGGWHHMDADYDNLALWRQKDKCFLHFSATFPSLKAAYMTHALEMLTGDESPASGPQITEEDPEMASLEKFYILDWFGHVLDYDPVRKEIVRVPLSPTALPNLFLSLERDVALPQTVLFRLKKGRASLPSMFLISSSDQPAQSNIVSLRNKEQNFLSINPKNHETHQDAVSVHDWEKFFILTEENLEALKALAFHHKPPLVWPFVSHNKGGFFQIDKDIFQLVENPDLKIEVLNGAKTIMAINSRGEKKIFQIPS